MNKKFSAFTLAEIIIAVTIIGVIAVLAINSIDVSDLKNKKIKLASQDFYNSIEQAYTKITNADRVKITATTTTAAVITNAFLGYINGAVIDCNNFGATTVVSVPESGAVCAKTSNGTMFATVVTVGRNASGEVVCNGNIFSDEDKKLLLEYKDDTKTERNLTDSVCGYILYKTPDSKGVFGEDLFTIALGHKALKSK